MSKPNPPAAKASPAAPSSQPGRAALHMPGYELPAAVYMTIIGAFAWMFAIAWIAFGAPDGTDLDLGMAGVLGVVFFAIPLAIHHTAFGRTHDRQTSMKQFMAAPFQTFTGAMPARQAWFEVAIIPVGLAVAATLFGAVFLLTN